MFGFGTLCGRRRRAPGGWVPPAAPTLTPSVISGDPIVGGSIELESGVVTGGTISLTQLRRGEEIVATGIPAILAYVFGLSDVSHILKVRQRALGNDGSTIERDSNPIGPITIPDEEDDHVSTFSISAPSAANEGDAGVTVFTFPVTRAGGLAFPAAVDYAVTGHGGNPANAADFLGDAFPAGTLNFAADEASKNILISIRGDTTVEEDEQFKVTLVNSRTFGEIGAAVAVATVLNDDSSDAPIYSVQPTATGARGGIITLTNGVASGSPTYEREFKVGGVITAVGLTYDDSATADQELTLRVTATNAGGSALSNLITLAAEVSEWPKTVTGVGASSGMLNASTVNQEISLLKPVGQIEFDLGIGMDATGANGLIYRFASGFFTLYFVNAGVETSSAFVNFKALNFEGLTVGDRLRARIYEPLEGETLGDIALFVNDTEVPESRLLGSHFTAGNAPRSTYCKYVRTFGAATVDVTYGPFPDGDGGVVDDDLIDNPLGTPEDRAGVTATTELLDAKSKAHYFEVDLPSPGAEFNMRIDAVDDQNYTELMFFGGADRLTLRKYVAGVESIFGSLNFWQIPTGTPQEKVRFIQDSPSNDLRLIIDDVEVEAFKVLGANRGAGVGNGEDVQFVKTGTATPFDLHWGPANSIPLNITAAIYNQGAQRIEFSIDYGAKPKGFFYSTNGGVTLTRAILVDNSEAGKADYQSEIVDISSSFNLYVENVEDAEINDTFAVPVYAPMEMGYAGEPANYYSPVLYMNNWGKHCEFAGHDPSLIYCPQDNITGSGTIRTSIGTTLQADALSSNVTVNSSNPSTGVHTYTISGPGEPTVFKWTGTKPTRFDVEPTGAVGEIDPRWIAATGSGAGFRTLNMRPSNFGTEKGVYVDDPTNILTAANRPKEDDIFWQGDGDLPYSEGTPFEVFIKLANACKAENPTKFKYLGLVNMVADDSYFIEETEHIRDHLSDGIQIFDEDPNETWNIFLYQGRNRVRAHAEGLKAGFYPADADGNPCAQNLAVTGSLANPSPSMSPMYIIGQDGLDPAKSFAAGEYLLDYINRVWRTKRTVSAGSPLVVGADYEIVIGGAEGIGGSWDTMDTACMNWLGWYHNHIIEIRRSILGEERYAEIMRPTICGQSGDGTQGAPYSQFEKRLNFVPGYDPKVTHLGEGFYLSETPHPAPSTTITKEDIKAVNIAGLPNLQARTQNFAAMCAAHGKGCYGYEGGLHWQGNDVKQSNSPEDVAYRNAFYAYQTDPMAEEAEEEIVRILRQYSSGPHFYFTRMGVGAWRLQRGLVADALDYRLNGHLAGFVD